jgi:hypothetical protein
MKVLKLSFAAIAFLFAGGFAPKPKASVDYYYISGTDYQRLEPGHTTEFDLCQRTIISNYFCDVSNWTTSPQLGNQMSDLSKYIGYITFDEETTADGGADGQLTLPEALNAVFAQYSAPSPDVMQASYTVGNATIRVTVYTACH